MRNSGAEFIVFMVVFIIVLIYLPYIVAGLMLVGLIAYLLGYRLPKRCKHEWTDNYTAGDEIYWTCSKCGKWDE